MPGKSKTLFRIAAATVLSVTAICGTTRFLLERSTQSREERAARELAAQNFLRKHSVFDALPRTRVIGMDISFLPDTSRTEHHHVHLYAADRFALGGTGYAGWITDQEIELDEMLRSQDVDEQLRSLVEEDGTSAGNLYALVGLRWSGSSEYQPLLRRLKASRAKVETMQGCSVKTVKVADIAHDIDMGYYDDNRPDKRDSIDNP